MAAHRDDKGRFIKGYCGGPGRPRKGNSFSELIQRHITDDELAKRLAELIRDGDRAALLYTIDRRHGKPVEKIDQTVRNAPEVVEIDLSEDDEADQGDSDALEE